MFAGLLTANDIGIWVLVLVALIPSANIVSSWIRGASPQRRIVEATIMETYATREELNLLRAEIGERLKDINDDMEVMESKSEKRAIALHERINEVLAAVSKLQGRMEK